MEKDHTSKFAARPEVVIALHVREGIVDLVTIVDRLHAQGVENPTSIQRDAKECYQAAGSNDSFCAGAPR